MTDNFISYGPASAAAVHIDLGYLQNSFGADSFGGHLFFQPPSAFCRRVFSFRVYIQLSAIFKSSSAVVASCG